MTETANRMAGKPKRPRRKQLPASSAISRKKTTLDRDRVAAVLACAEASGLTLSKGGRILGRLSPELIKRAKTRNGLQSDTELVEFVLANIALEDNFSQVFQALKGTVDPDLDLGF